MHKIFQLIRHIGGTKSTVLIEGETGTGKELIAKAVHSSSEDRQGNLIAINCAALPESLLESELFGHERGAFTSADARRKGRFELADKGTIFLDEIGDISPAMQAKLLRVLQEQQVRASRRAREHRGRHPGDRRDEQEPGAAGQGRASSARTSSTGST